MWARIVELMLGVWLALSPFVFRYESEEIGLWIVTYVAATLVILFALLSYYPRLEKAHLLEIGVAGWLVGTAFLQPEPPPPPAYQNFVCVGLLLLMFGIIPSRASIPPRRWREFYERRGDQ